MSVITEEVVYMGDLAQAIVALARASERRQGARADLVDSTDTIARAIRELLRSGDSVEVEGHQDPLLNLLYTTQVTYRAVSIRKRMSTGSGKPEDALLRIASKKSAVFGTQTSGAYNLLPGDEIVHAASDEERQAFVHEADRVVAAFRRILDEQATKNEAAAKKATKLTPR
jgi:hypothetical protein